MLSLQEVVCHRRNPSICFQSNWYVVVGVRSYHLAPDDRLCNIPSHQTGFHCNGDRNSRSLYTFCFWLKMPDFNRSSFELQESMFLHVESRTYRSLLIDSICRNSPSLAQNLASFTHGVRSPSALIYLFPVL